MPPIDMRIGVATGEVVVGNIGSDVSMSYTVMGDSVNFASRLEGVSTAYGTRFLVSARTAAMVSETIECREVDQLRVEGKQEPEHIFEVLGRRGEVPARVREMTQYYAEGLPPIGNDPGRPRPPRLPLLCRQAVPDDGPSLEFMQRVARLEADPPPSEWDGVWTLREK